MKITEKIKSNWKKKSLLGKLTDIFFYILIISIIIPASRTEVLGFVNRIRASIVQPSVKNTSDAKVLNDIDYNWKIKKLNGKEINFSEFEGKVIFLNFWATWCPPCIGEMPGIQNLYDKYKNNTDVVFVIISNESEDKVNPFIIRKEYNFDVYTSRYKTPNIFASNVIPATYIISKKGKIVVKETGAAKWDGEKITKLIDKLCKEQIK